jgi:hypothetical protein
MKFSKPLCALILIVSALLVSAACGASAESPSQPNQSTQTQTPAQQHNAIASPTASALNQSPAVPTGSASATYIYNQYKQSSRWGNVPAWLEAIATIGLLFFAGWQMSLIKAAAVAARDNAEAAKLQAQAAVKTFQLAVRARIEVHPTVALESASRTLTVYFEILNQGETAAKIQFQTFNFFYKYRQWTYPPRFPSTPEHSPHSLPEIFQAHDRVDDYIETVRLDGLIGDGLTTEWDRYIAGDMLACFCAHIVFFAEGDLFQETFLCETWDRQTKRFFVDPEMPRGWNRSG